MSTEEVSALFMKNLTAVKAIPARVSSMAELGRVIAELLREDRSVYCAAVTKIEKGLSIDPEKRVDKYTAAEVTVEEALAAIAETGSIVCTSADGKAMQANVLARRHVAVVRADRIFADLDDYLSSIGGVLPANITLITGPSRTGDIEQTLTVGMHGPGRLDVIVVDAD
ncbi:MAG: lactate utilization protein [Desulfomonile tiedjei]|nr:lactate utilization protein [Desulfomonile tiedjei]